ncbi:MFS transporter [Rothia uropygioeca]|uniref:MFS transporter n=1 Tax=Kocuria sp. 257 TaxID=2021970 RepID=UPI0013ED369E|nr:MFS transporter [Kocuria sp. 257]
MTAEPPESEPHIDGPTGGESIRESGRRSLPRPPVPTDLKVLVVAAFVIAAGYGVVAPVLPQFATSFGVGAAAAGAVMSAFALMRVAWAPAAGPIMSRIGERRTYLTGLAVVALSSAITAFAPNYALLVILRGLGGIGSVMFSISAMGLIARLAPPTIRAKVSGYYATSFMLGSIMGPVIGSLTATWGLRAPFIIYALALLLAIVVAAWKLRPADATTDTGSVMLPMKFPEALSIGSYRSLLVTSFAHGWANLGARVAIIPLLATGLAASVGAPAQGFGSGASIAGIALGIFAGGSALAQIIFGGLSDRWGRKPLLILGLSFSAVLTGIVGLSPGPWVFWILCLMAGLSTGLYTPSMQATLTDVVGSRRSGGNVMSAYQACADVGQIIAPVILGAVVDRVGFGPAFGISGALLGIAALVFFLTPRTSFPQSG